MDVCLRCVIAFPVIWGWDCQSRFSFFVKGARVLILLLGPSGVGKTSIIEEMVRRFSWTPLMSYVTRASRGRDFKIHVSHQDFECLAKYGKLWSDVTQLGERYGTSKAEVTLALQGQHEFCILDFSLTRRQEFFSHVPHLPVVVMPESPETLADRLKSIGREDRVRSAQEEMCLLEEIREDPLRAREYRFVVNRTGELDTAVSAIRGHADEWAKRT